MEAIRKIQNVSNGEIRLHLPKQFWGKEVEIIVLAAATEPQPTAGRKSLRGALKQYAKPERMAQEQEAWQAAVSEKYERR